ncbi:MAG: hypothetical protein ABFD98_05300 [Syntrophobacteraceae bacterium]|nr:hypothetical protein [Desulfobacteraceae bacterium]
MITDLTAAGYPFDVVAYERFVDMSFGDSDAHDVVILNGHTAPIPVADVAAKCLRWLQAGRKIFINGYLPFTRYDDGGKQVETVEYGQELFDFTFDTHWVNGKAIVPEDLEKDREITSIGHFLSRVHTCRLKSQQDRSMTLNGHTIAFLTAKGGVVSGTSDYILNLLDYGKVVNHLRYGGTGMVGFANDRIGGKPLVSFEVHCDATRDLAAIDAVESLADEFRLPLLNLLVRDKITEAAAKRWNEASRNPFMAIGSHSRTHPQDWPSVSDFDDQTRGALESQRAIVPATGTYFNFSGAMNPTPRQIDDLYRSGTIFGAKGQDSRWAGHPFGVPWCSFWDSPLKSLARHFLSPLWPPREIQVMPTNLKWLIALSQTEATPYCLSQTLPSDFEVWESKKNYDEEIRKYFGQNVKYGLYTYGYIHDYANNTIYDKFRTRGVHLAYQIRSALTYLRSKNVEFIGTENLIRRLRDFATGWIDYDTLPDGWLHVTVHRENALANDVKVGSRNNMVPVASGESVTDQHLIGNTLYICLKPEVKSSFYVYFISNQ